MLCSFWDGAVKYLIQTAGQAKATKDTHTLFFSLSHTHSLMLAAHIALTGKPQPSKQRPDSLQISHTHTHTHTHRCQQTTSGAPVQPTCPLKDHHWLVDQCLLVWVEVKNKKRKEKKKKTLLENIVCTYVYVCVCVCVCLSVPHEPRASHKIQLWKNRRSLFATDNSSTHKHLQGSEPSVVTDCSISPSVCESVWAPHIFLLDINHCLLNVCERVVSESLCSLWLGM